MSAKRKGRLRANETTLGQGRYKYSESLGSFNFETPLAQVVSSSRKQGEIGAPALETSWPGLVCELEGGWWPVASVLQ